MMNTSTSMYRTIAAAAVLIALATVLGAQEKPAPATFSVRSESTTLGEPVWIDLAVRNTTADTVTIDLGQDRKAKFRLHVTTPDGQSHEVPQLSRDGISVSGEIPIPVSHTYRQEILLDEWYDVDVPGQYQIAIGIGDEPRQVLRLQVLERNAAKLEEIARSLHAQALAPDFETADRAALVLSSIDDPIAVPFLASLLARRQPHAARGLRKIATKEAVDALIGGLSQTDIAVHAAVRAELRRLRSTLADAGQIRRIDDAVAADRTAAMELTR